MNSSEFLRVPMNSVQLLRIHMNSKEFHGTRMRFLRIPMNPIRITMNSYAFLWIPANSYEFLTENLKIMQKSINMLKQSWNKTFQKWQLKVLEMQMWVLFACRSAFSQSWPHDLRRKLQFSNKFSPLFWTLLNVPHFSWKQKLLATGNRENFLAWKWQTNGASKRERER